MKQLRCPVAVLTLAGLISAFALIAALLSEIFLGLEPCPLCVYQRIPFAIGVIIAGLVWAARDSTPIRNALLGLGGLTYLTNSAIAFYHTGVEQKWWRSALEGCAVPHFGEQPENWLENILSAPTARCDEIPWQDPFLGLSMANYNVILCFGLFALCALSLLMQRRAG